MVKTSKVSESEYFMDTTREIILSFFISWFYLGVCVRVILGDKEGVVYERVCVP